MEREIFCTLDVQHKGGTYKGKSYKGDAELDSIAEKVVELLRWENLPIWQAKDVLKKAVSLMDWELLK